MPPSLTAQLRVEIRERIISTQLHPGDLVLEKVLAEEFGVSKTPVREALIHLAEEGWLRVIPRRGYTVSSMGFHDIREIMEVRKHLEPPLAAAAAAVRTDELVAELRTLVATHTRATDVGQGTRAAHAFHERLARAARNQRALTTLKRLWSESERAYRLLPPLADHITAEAELGSHRRLVEAVDAGDPDEARSVMARHIDEAQQAMVDAFFHHTPS